MAFTGIGLAYARSGQKRAANEAREITALQENLPKYDSSVSIAAFHAVLAHQSPEYFSSRFMRTSVGQLKTTEALYGGRETKAFVEDLAGLATKMEEGLYVALGAYRGTMQAADILGAVTDTCWFLDRALPITDACDKTPVTGENERHWFDFINARVQPRLYEMAA